VQRTQVEQHTATCSACRAIVLDLASSSAAVVASFRPTGSFRIDETAPPPVLASFRPSSATVERQMPARSIELVPGTMIGEYKVTGVIGAGGMGAVFSAVHPRIGKQAAIKVLKRDHVNDAQSVVRFENEARAVNEIRHPNIVDIFGFGELDGTPYFVMERVEGESLQSWLEKRGALTLDQAMPVLTQIFDALAAAHERDIVHRDLKPGNIMVAGSDLKPRIKVLDFGLAKMAPGGHDLELTLPGVPMGTPLFMSPEQFLGQEIDHRTDIYALGVIVYQMLCGRYPFSGNTPTAVGMQHVVEAPPVPSSIVAGLVPDVDAVILKALAKDVEDRYQSVSELRDALVRLLAATEAAVVPVAAADSNTKAVVRRALRRRAFIVGFAIAGGVVLGAITFVTIQNSKKAAPAPAVEPTTQVTQTPIPTPIPTPTPAPSPAPIPTQPSPAVEPPVAEVPEPPVVTAGSAAEPTPPADSKRVVRTGTKRKTGTRVQIKRPPTTGAGSASTTPRCDPYKSVDGC
jgi:serine/threonine-protein kinase